MRKILIACATIGLSLASITGLHRAARAQTPGQDAECAKQFGEMTIAWEFCKRHDGYTYMYNGENYSLDAMGKDYLKLEYRRVDKIPPRNGTGTVMVPISSLKRIEQVSSKVFKLVQ